MPENHAPNEDEQLMYSPPPASVWRQRLARSLGFVASVVVITACLLSGFVLSFSLFFHGIGLHPCEGRQGGCSLPPISPPTFSSISMVSPDEGWAVGGDVHYIGFIRHDVDGKWTQVSAHQSFPYLFSVFMLSASDGWSVSGDGIILHYTGGQWVRVASPTYSALTSVFMLSPTDGWAVGGTVILHYTGGIWTTVTTSAPILHLRSIAMVSPTEGWAVGADVIAHYHNGAWTTLAPSELPSTSIDLTSVTMLSPSEGWAVGSWGNGAAILHYANSQWSLSPVSWIGSQMPGQHSFLAAVAMVSPTEGWAVGTDPHTGSSIILHDTQGAWTQVPTRLHVSLTGISMVSASEGWAVGDQDTLLHYLNGTWSVYVQG